VNLLSVAPPTVLLALLTVGAGPDAKAPGASVAAPSTPLSLAQVMVRVDELHKRRDDRAAWAEEQSLVEGALARAPRDYDVLWRAARTRFWLSDDPGQSKEQRSRVGKDGWDLAERAVAINPNRVEGQYWAAVCMGNYALGLGVVKALSEGMEGKFRERLGRAEQLDRGYEHGAVDTAWGRFFDKLPWPKRDRAEAERHFKRAVEINPLNLRARVYLASSYLDQDRAADAKRLLDEVAAVPAVGRYDPPEERRAKAIGAGLMPQVAARLR
jgi:tetratricopeptide (TPR) repeat protein